MKMLKTPKPASKVSLPWTEGQFDLPWPMIDQNTGAGPEARYYADPDANVNVQFFDSSVRRIRSSEANPGWDPSDISVQGDGRSDVEDATGKPLVTYGSIDTRYFPDYDTDNILFSAKYKWTRAGLKGLDVGGREISTAAWCN